MTTSPPAPPPRPRQPSRLHLPGDARRRLHVTSAVVGSLLIAVLSGCSNDANGKAVSHPLPSITSPSITPSAVDQQAALLAQYRKFWASLTPLSRMPAPARRTVLAQLAVDPALKSLLAGMTDADRKRQVLYGENVPRPTVRINPDATIALVDDCQDSSHAGVADKATGKRLTVGVPRNRVSVTMKRQPGQLWKVAYVDYAKSPC